MMNLPRKHERIEAREIKNFNHKGKKIKKNHNKKFFLRELRVPRPPSQAATSTIGCASGNAGRAQARQAGSW
jgi:hypothetical protein